MAVTIVLEGGPIDGYMIHNKDPRGVSVMVTHHPHQGYRPAADGSTIRERLELREFLDRVVRTEYMDKRGHDYRRKVEEEMFQILRILTHATHEAAERLGRNSIGVDSSRETCEAAYHRLKNEVNQTKLSGDQSTIEKEGF